MLRLFRVFAVDLTATEIGFGAMPGDVSLSCLLISFAPQASAAGLHGAEQKKAGGL